jgi:hypothetical protein
MGNTYLITEYKTRKASLVLSPSALDALPSFRFYAVLRESPVQFLQSPAEAVGFSWISIMWVTSAAVPGGKLVVQLDPFRAAI